MTFGVPKGLLSLSDWARALDLQSPLFLIFDAAGCIDHPQYTGTVLRYLLQPAPAGCLKRWSAERPYLHHLTALLDACSVSPSVFRDQPGMPIELSVSRQLTGGLLSFLPLIALIARPVQCQTPESQEWIETLQAWCFVQHLEAVYSGREVNRYLTTITSKLRQAIDRDQRWMLLFEQLQGSPNDTLQGITRHLRGASESLRASKTDLLPTERSLLADLRSYASGKEPISSDLNKVYQGGLFNRHVQNTALKTSSDLLAIEARDAPWPETESETRSLGVVTYDESSDEAMLSVIEVNDEDSPLVQRRKSAGVLLSTVEDHQFLPYSWNRIAPHELHLLHAWIDTTLSAESLEDRLVALAAWLAIRTSCSIRTVLKLEIDSNTTDAWRLSPKSWALHRRPPRRYNGWRAGETHARWIAPRADELVIKLPEMARHDLETLWTGSSSLIGTLADCLPGSTSLEQRFNQTCRLNPGLQRLTGGMLKNVLAQQTFENTQDATLSLLMASHPRTGLPGSCAYASYGAQQVSSALTISPAQHQTHIYICAAAHPEDADLNAAGSELDLVDSLLTEACASALSKLNHLSGSPEQWVEHHNALTAYCVLALLACTGARPVTSPFESLAQIDLDAGLIFIDDKVSSAQHQGRLMPLSLEVTNLIRKSYLPHLLRLSKLLARMDPGLSNHVAELARPGARQRLPLFFFLASTPALSWVEVSERTMSALELFDWPLPWNLMRHRMSTRLRRMGIDHEIVNGFCGHGEQGTAAYGRFSGRTFQHDRDATLPALESLYMELGLRLPQTPQWPVEAAVLVTVSADKVSRQAEQIFGANARQARRHQDHARARAQAQEDIIRMLDGRKVDTLSSKQWEEIGQSMLLLSTGMPHPLGSLRYETFLNWLDDQWRELGARPRLKKRYLPALEEPSPFTSDSIGAAKLLECARQTLDGLKVIPISRTSRRDARVLACFSLVVNGRIGDLTLVKDVLAGHNTRLIRFDGEMYLEHAQSLDRWPDAPFRRFWIGNQAATWWTHSMDGANQLNHEKLTIPAVLTAMLTEATSESEPTRVADLLGLLTKTVRQCNAMEYPGHVAAFLNGQIVTAALDHLDWIRATKGFAADLSALQMPSGQPREVEAAAEDDEADLEGYEGQVTDDFVMNTSGLWRATEKGVNDRPHATLQMASHQIGQSTRKVTQAAQDSQAVQSEGERQQQAARSFFVELRFAIATHAKKKSSPRRDLDSALRAIIEHSAYVSPTCKLLGEWTRSLLWRRVRRGLLRLSSVERYLNALSVCFEAEAFNHDLAACESEDLTEFYRRILDSRRLVRITNTSSKAADQPDEEKPNGDSYRTWRLAANLLRDFHRLCARQLALEDPDWSEFLAEDVPLSISPGLLLEQDYLHALTYLVSGNVNSASHRALAEAFLLLLCMRFGLRGREALYLMRDDWINTQDGSVVVLVRNNQKRDLKTVASRRQVPLLFELDPLENNIIERFMALWEGVSGGDKKTPLFVDPDEPHDIFDHKHIRAKLSKVIKQSTLNQNLSLHHARHSFGNCVARVLLEGSHQIWPHVSVNVPTTLRVEHVRKLLLGTEKTTRRSFWALARLLGHAHPNSSIRSYLHLLPELAAKLVRSGLGFDEGAGSQSTSSRTVDLDDTPALDNYLQIIAPSDQEKPQFTNLQCVLRFLHLFQNGSLPKAAAFAVAMPLPMAEVLVKCLEKIDTTLASKSQINPHLGGASRLLSHITQTRWRYWIDLAKNQEMVAKEIIDLNRLDNLMEQIGPTRQVLLYKEDHFNWFRRVVDFWGLSDKDFSILGSRGLHTDVDGWATKHGFSARKPEYLGERERPVQIDSAGEGRPPMIVRHRCAAIAKTTQESAITSSFEIVFLYLTASFILQNQNRGPTS